VDRVAWSSATLSRICAHASHMARSRTSVRAAARLAFAPELRSSEHDRPFVEEPRMSVLGWIIFGLIVGIVAKLLMPGRDPGGFVVTILIGVAGALVGGFLGRLMGLYREDDPVGFFMALGGSILLLWLYRRINRPAAT
jgi:uncharacterized membrane protein YeaQ/YmgE (transglycosylase-associated protein family)